MFIGIGIAAIYVSRDYPIGSTMSMGPGYFPTLLGGILTLFGIIIAGRSFWIEGEGVSGWAFRPLLVLVVALATYGVLLDHFQLGFVPSLVLLIAGSALAHEDVHWIEMILLSIFLTIGCVALFIFGIGLPYKLFWWS